jgi:putative oxidoreductase
MLRMFEKSGDTLYFVFRVLAGLLFFQHGAQKLLGWFGGNKVALFSQMGLAGTIELLGGLFIALGLFTRLAALFSGLLMLAAYFMAHFSQGLVPIVNGGELALLYLATWLVLLAYGAKKWSLEKALWNKERF